MVTWQQLGKTEINPFDVVRTSTSGYQASNGEFVITDQPSVQLPSPQLEGYVAIRAEDKFQKIKINSPSGKIYRFDSEMYRSDDVPTGFEGAGISAGNGLSVSAPTGENVRELRAGAGYSGQKPAIFVSDGVDWYCQQSKSIIQNYVPSGGKSRFLFEQNLEDIWNRRDATDNTSAGYVTNSKQGNYAKEYDGNDDVIAIPIGTDFFGQSEFTVAFWYNRRSNDTGNVNETALSYNNREWGIGYNDINNTGGIELYVGSNSATAVGDPNVGNNEWVFIVIRNNSGTHELLLNDAVSQGSYDGSFNTGSSNCYVGGGGSDNMPLYTDRMDFYNKALSDEEISNLYNNGSITGV